ncbi:MAG: hypothetical protein IJG05_04735, partial [Solobacterium sp.]|nr:hypothetical protein [Solobacterium sp.]
LYHDGYFGRQGESKRSSIRNIESDDPSRTAQAFYDELTHGGLEYTLYKKDGTENGKYTEMADGTRINWRPVSSSADGSPAVDIDIQFSDDHGDLKTQKNHFVRRK